jgi:hypothetical protein
MLLKGCLRKGTCEPPALYISRVHAPCGLSKEGPCSCQEIKGRDHAPGRISKEGIMLLAGYLRKGSCSWQDI